MNEMTPPAMGMRSPNESAASMMRKIVDRYWSDYPEHMKVAVVEKTAFEFELLRTRVGAGETVCDVGGGWGAFACLAAAMGMKSILVDDFGDPGMAHKEDVRIRMPEAFGVQFVRRDVVADGLNFAEDSIDAFTTFDMLEHLHSSPRPLLHQMMRMLRPGGVLLIGVPNCVNLRKRITIPLGRGKWSALEEWYDSPVFRGHVREPDVDDLRYIARDLQLVDPHIHGANSAGLQSPISLIRALTRAIDPIMRLRPSLCSGLYLLGRKRD